MLVTFPSPIPKLQHALLPLQVLQAKERACCNLSLGLATKAKKLVRLRAKKKPGSQGKEAAKVRAKKKPKSHITYSRECKKM
jgi:hypothetical protein